MDNQKDFLFSVINYPLKNMLDLIFISVIIIFFLLAIAYLRFCEKLK